MKNNARIFARIRKTGCKGDPAPWLIQILAYVPKHGRCELDHGYAYTHAGALEVAHNWFKEAVR